MPCVDRFLGAEWHRLAAVGMVWCSVVLSATNAVAQAFEQPSQETKRLNSIAPLLRDDRTQRVTLDALTEGPEQPKIKVPSIIMQPVNIGDAADEFRRQNPGRDWMKNEDELAKAKTSDCEGAAARLLTELRTTEFPEQALVDAFDKHCLNPHPAGRPAHLPPAVDTVVGIVLVPAGDDIVIPCSGLRINRDTVLTARHCFFNAHTAGLGDWNTYLPWLDVSFVPAAGGKPVDVMQLVPNARFANNPAAAGPFPTAHDFVFLKLDTSAESGQILDALPLPEIKFDQPRPGDMIAIFGHLGYGTIGDGRTQARWSASNRCVVHSVAHGCLAHFCDTSGGFSGGAVLRLDGDRTAITVIGLHTEAARNDNGTCPLSGPNGNLAAVAVDEWQQVAAGQ